MTLLSPLYQKIVLNKQHLVEYATLISSSGWLVKNKEVLQSGTPEEFWVRRTKFKKGHFLFKKTLLTNANFSVEESFYNKKLNKDQKLISVKVFAFRWRCFIYLVGKYFWFSVHIKVKRSCCK